MGRDPGRKGGTAMWKKMLVPAIAIVLAAGVAIGTLPSGNPASAVRPVKLQDRGEDGILRRTDSDESGEEQDDDDRRDGDRTVGNDGTAGGHNTGDGGGTGGGRGVGT